MASVPFSMNILPCELSIGQRIKVFEVSLRSAWYAIQPYSVHSPYWYVQMAS